MAVFVVVVSLEEDSVAAAETTLEATTSSQTHPHKSEEVVREDQHSGGRGGAQGAQHVYVAPTAFENAKELLAGLCYACGSPHHRSGEAACPKGKKGAFKQKGRLQVTIQEQQQHNGAQAQDRNLVRKRRDAAALRFRTFQRQENSAIFGKAQHPASPFAQIYQRTRMSGMPAVVGTQAVPYSEIYSQQQQAIGS